MQFRAMSVALDQVRALSEGAAADERVPIALSSEEPFARDYGVEILGHTPDEIDMSRAVQGLALLNNHDPADQVGIVEDITLDEDRVLRGMARFSASERGQEFKADVLSGIRKWSSIGYMVHRMVLQSTNPDVFRVTAWTPYEATITPIPVDPTVGTYRSADRAVASVDVTSALRAVDVTTPSPESTTAPQGQESSMDSNTPVPAAEIVRLCNENDMGDKAPEFLQRGLSVDAVAREILSAKRSVAPVAPSAPVLELSEKDAARYSVTRAILGSAEGKLTGLEKEVHDEMRRSMGRDTAGVYIPTRGMQVRAANPNALLATGAGKGKETVATQTAEFIDILRNKSAFLGRGVSMLSGLTGNISFPKVTGTTAATWQGENPGVDVAASVAAFGQLGLAPKTLSGATAYSRQALIQSTVDMENFVRGDLAKIHALAIDAALIAGDGVTAPKGILNVNGVHAVACGVKPTFEHIVALETEVEDANVDLDACSYVTTPRLKGVLKTTPQLANTIGQAIWQGQEMNGYGAFASKQVPAEHVIFGDLSQLVVGEWGALEIITDPYTMARQGLIGITSIQFVDAVVRYAEAFAAISDAKLVG